MKDLSGTYVHRGDMVRRRRRMRGAFMLAGLVTAGMLAARNWEPRVADAEPVFGPPPSAAVARRKTARVRTPLERWNRIFSYARRFRIHTDLSAAIYNAALAEGIDPELAFPLVELESRFDEGAVSPVGAVGLMQLMPATARAYAKDVTIEQLLDRETNLRIGLRYLRDLIREQRGDVQVALLVYNRGYSAVSVSRELGLDPSNGYDRVVLRQYRGKGVID
jgi:soluble lytic murein transglycosylase-like protein